MIIKDADDRRPELARRRALLAQSGDPSERMRLKREIRFINAGIRGERDAAYEMRVHWDDSKDWMVIHDLRVEHDGLTAQIDHLIINRWMEFWVCESKHFSQGVAINEHGEFSAFFGSKPYGVPSPIEQNNRHILILRRIIDSGAIDLPRRLGVTIRPDFKSLVLVSNRARITRPETKINGIDCIIKCDQLFRTVQTSLGDRKLLSLAKYVGRKTIANLAQSIAALHRPVRFSGAVRPAALTATQGPATATEPSAPARRPERTPICSSCGKGVSDRVAEFCAANERRFAGRTYCWNCQRQVGNRLQPSAKVPAHTAT